MMPFGGLVDPMSTTKPPIFTFRSHRVQESAQKEEHFLRIFLKKFKPKKPIFLRFVGSTDPCFEILVPMYSIEKLYICNIFAVLIPLFVRKSFQKPMFGYF